MNVKTQQNCTRDTSDIPLRKMIFPRMHQALPIFTVSPRASYRCRRHRVIGIIIIFVAASLVIDAASARSRR